jgi:uncharacterized protein (TIGR01619 family)
MEKDNKSNHETEWDFYMSNVDSVIGSFFIDLGLAKIAPVADKPNLVSVAITMNNPREDGLSSDEESKLLYEIEDKIEECLLKNHNAIYAGRLTSNGKRFLYYYMNNTDNYEKNLHQVNSEYPDYDFGYYDENDKDWNTYFDFLYPSPEQYQMMMNRRVIRGLKEQGDNPDIERMVDHWIYFKKELDMENYILEISKQNFQVIDKEKRGKAQR